MRTESGRRGIVREGAAVVVGDAAAGVAWEWAGAVVPEGTDTVVPEAVDTVAQEDPDDELYVLGERCAEAYMQADTLQYEAMTLLAEFDQRQGWEDTGFGSTVEWLAWRIGIRPGAARERLRTAIALEQLPATSKAMKNGEISFSKVRALTRVASAENEETLLEFARAGSAANLERVVQGWKRMDRKSEVSAEQLRYRSRTFSAFIDDDGMVVVRGRLDPEAGAMLMRAVEAAGDALFRRDWTERTERAGTGGGSAGVSRAVGGNVGRDGRDRGDIENETTPDQRRADALGLLAERALAAGFTDGPVSGSRADRTQVVLHVEASTLTEGAEPGTSELDDGTRVSAETSRRVACDTGVVRMTHDRGGRIMSVGRRTRTVPPSLRRALEVRDRGCRFPGCGLRFTDAHHVKHWADGGETRLRNLVLLCRRHHRAVHEGGVRVCIDKTQQIVFFTPKGAVMSPAPRFRGNGRTHVRNGRPQAPRALDRDPIWLRPTGWDGSARWKRDSEVPWQVEARALDALEEPGVVQRRP